MKDTYWVLKTDFPSYYSSRFTFVVDIDYADIFFTEDKANTYIDILKQEGITAELKPVKVSRTTTEIKG